MNKDNMFDEIITCLMEKMLKDKFENPDNSKYILSKQELYQFGMRLIKVIKEVYGE